MSNRALAWIVLSVTLTAACDKYETLPAPAVPAQETGEPTHKATPDGPAVKLEGPSQPPSDSPLWPVELFLAIKDDLLELKDARGKFNKALEQHAKRSLENKLTAVEGKSVRWEAQVSVVAPELIGLSVHEQSLSRKVAEAGFDQSAFGMKFVFDGAPGRNGHPLTGTQSYRPKDRGEIDRARGLGAGDVVRFQANVTAVQWVEYEVGKSYLLVFVKGAKWL